MNELSEALSIVAGHAWALGYDTDDPAGFNAIEEVPTAGEACGRLAQAKRVWTCKAWVYAEAAHEAQACADPTVAAAIRRVIEAHIAQARPRKGSASLEDMVAANDGC